jgi:hypothetical protein
MVTERTFLRDGDPGSYYAGHMATSRSLHGPDDFFILHIVESRLADFDLIRN